MCKVTKAVIPAAGLGTRFLPATKAQPKEMLPIVDKPAIQYIVEEAIASGIQEILLITGRSKRAIEDHFDRSIELELTLEKKQDWEMLDTIKRISDINIHYIRQKEARGLGHAVLCAKQFVGNEPFAVLLGDDLVVSEVPCLKQLMDVHEHYGGSGSVLGCRRVPWEQISSYGIIKPAGEPLKENVCRVEGLVEKPSADEAPSDLAVMGRYIISPDIFPILEKIAPGRGGEIQLTDALAELIGQQNIYACNFEGKRYDIGDKLGYITAQVEFAMAQPEIHDQLLAYLGKLVQKKAGK